MAGRWGKALGPAWAATAPAMGAGRRSCDRDQVFELLEAALADAWDLKELVDGGEGVGGAVGDDAVGGDLADAGEGVELFRGGGVEVEGGGRGAAEAAWGGGGVGRGCGVAGSGDPDLFTVGELAGEIDRVQVGTGGHAAGGTDGVVDAAAGGQADQAGAADPAGHMDGHLAGGRGRGRRVGRGPGQGLVRWGDRFPAGRR